MIKQLSLLKNGSEQVPINNKLFEDYNLRVSHWNDYRFYCSTAVHPCQIAEQYDISKFFLLTKRIMRAFKFVCNNK